MSDNKLTGPMLSDHCAEMILDGRFVNDDGLKILAKAFQRLRTALANEQARVAELEAQIVAAPVLPAQAVPDGYVRVCDAIAICRQEAAEWDSDNLITHKNYAATCADRIAMLATGKVPGDK